MIDESYQDETVSSNPFSRLWAALWGWWYLSRPITSVEYAAWQRTQRYHDKVQEIETEFEQRLQDQRLAFEARIATLTSDVQRLEDDLVRKDKELNLAKEKAEAATFSCELLAATVERYKSFEDFKAIGYKRRVKLAEQTATGM